MIKFLKSRLLENSPAKMKIYFYHGRLLIRTSNFIYLKLFRYLNKYFNPVTESMYSLFEFVFLCVYKLLTLLFKSKSVSILRYAMNIEIIRKQ